MNNAVEVQKGVLDHLIHKARNTRFGKDHSFRQIKNYEAYKKAVPVRDYEALKPYFDQLKKGDKNVLWPGKPLYFCTTSGTTSGSKYIPITRDSMPNNIRSTRNAVLQYLLNSGNTGILDGKFIQLQGSPELYKISGIKTGRLSGIVAHHVPFYLQKKRKPSFRTNSIEDWEEKVEAIVDETLGENMTVIGGIPPWVQMYFESLIKRSGKKNIKEIFPNLGLFITGGVNFSPYKKSFDTLLGFDLDTVEIYPASEGFFAYQDQLDDEGLLLLVNEKIFYEFIPADQVWKEDPERLSLGEVELGVNYALVLSTSAGLWSYLIGDTIMFTSLHPYRIKVSGRVDHFTSAFGEHVIAEEVEYALKKAIEKHPCEIADFTVAPMVNPPDGQRPYHEWLIEFKSQPSDPESFRLEIDQHMQKRNSYYKDLVEGQILQPLLIRSLQKNAFKNYMQDQGKLGGQNKLPRLSNDRKMANALQAFVESPPF
jgi:hypothetical protein